MPIDYKALLKEYMGLVIDCEAYSYLEEAEEDVFTEEAMIVLRQMETECYSNRLRIHTYRLHEEPNS